LLIPLGAQRNGGDRGLAVNCRSRAPQNEAASLTKGRTAEKPVCENDGHQQKKDLSLPDGRSKHSNGSGPVHGGHQLAQKRRDVLRFRPREALRAIRAIVISSFQGNGFSQGSVSFLTGNGLGRLSAGSDSPPETTVGLVVWRATTTQARLSFRLLKTLVR